MNAEAIYETLHRQIEQLVVRQAVATVHGQMYSLIEVDRKKIRSLLNQIESFVRIYAIDRTHVSAFSDGIEDRLRELESLAAQYRFQPDDAGVEQAHACELLAQKMRVIIYLLHEVLHRPTRFDERQMMNLVETA